MKRSRWLPALTFVATTAVAACFGSPQPCACSATPTPPTNGWLEIYATCAAPACAKTGTLSIQLHPADCAPTILLADSAAGVSLARNGQTGPLGSWQLPPGAYCVSARLTSAGVVFIPSAGDQPVSITAGLTTSAIFTIDTATTP